MRKEKWGKPKLVVLLAGKPEENTLTVCKQFTQSGGMRTTDTKCQLYFPCAWCIQMNES